MIPTLIGVGVTLILSAGAAVFAYGRNVEALTTNTATLNELRRSVANLLARVQALETRGDVERELSGRVRVPVRGGDEG